MVAVKKSAKPIEAEDGEIFSASSFSSLGLHSNLCDQLQERLGFKAPTLVQAQAIPVILSGRHVLVNAATGTGKTVAYLAPVIHHLSLHQPRIQRSDVPGYVMGGENRDKEKASFAKAYLFLWQLLEGSWIT
ncbi:hypothetical protein M0R45_003724 [Rubus argutus]|uniref:DEAD-box RNA helicase Q domain-containing protein n=1 Tax=Rubus argutus TaxID=59490 RepID=A0AAW1YG09_RUBAR